MCSMRGVTDQNNIVVPPSLILDSPKVDPGRLVGKQRLPFQLISKQTFTILNTFFLGSILQPRIAPRRIIGLDNESAHVFIERIGMYLKKTVDVFANNKDKRLENTRRREPDIFALANCDIRLEMVRKLRTNTAVDTIGADD